MSNTQNSVVDPNATLAELRELTSTLKKLHDNWLRIEELFTALDDWLSKGGALPNDWCTFNDRHCVTEEDGACVSEAKCMHSPREER